MGKGNVKSFKGKLFKHSFGKYRPRKQKGKINNPINTPLLTERLDIKIPIAPLQRGDIIWAKDRVKHFHPIVYLGEFEEKGERYQDHFKACILSTKDVGENKQMDATHFCTKNRNAQLYAEYINPKFIVPKNVNRQYLVTECTFSKATDWIDFTDTKNIVGRLSKEGLEFVEKHLSKRVASLDAPMREKHKSIWDYKEE